MKRKLVILLGDKKKVRRLCEEAIKAPQMFYKINEQQLLEDVTFVNSNLISNISIKFFKQHEEFLKNKFDVVIMEEVSANIAKAAKRLIEEFYILPQNRGKLMVEASIEGEKK